MGLPVSPSKVDYRPDPAMWTPARFTMPICLNRTTYQDRMVQTVPGSFEPRVS